MNHRDTETQSGAIPDDLNRTSGIVIKAAFAVHSQLGPGLLKASTKNVSRTRCAGVGCTYNARSHYPLISRDYTSLQGCG
jgi:hypothetical protein